MERKQIIIAIAIIVLSLGGIMGIMACGNSATAPSDYTITVPSDGDFTVSNANSSRSVFQDSLVIVTDGDGKTKEGIKLKIYGHGSFGGFYSNNQFTGAQLSNPYEDVTDGSGVVLVNYRTAAFTCNSTEQTYTLGYRAQSGSVSTVHTDTFTVKQCGT